MARELEDAEDAEDSQGHKSPRDILIFRHHQPNVIRHDGHNVNDTHHALHELKSTWGRKKPHEILKGEDEDTSRIHAEESFGETISAGHASLLPGRWPAGDCLHHIGND